MIETIAKIISKLTFILAFFLLGLFAPNIPAFKSFIDYLILGQNTLNEALYLIGNQEDDNKLHVWFDDPEQTHNDYILFSHHFRDNPALRLIDKNGDVVHSWNFSKEISNPKIYENEYSNFPIETSYQTIADAHILPNGDLIASQMVLELDNYRGQRLVRVDKNSNIIWEINDNFHHDMFLDEEYNIYSITSDLVSTFPFVDYAGDDVMYLTDIINITSVDGKTLARYSITDALANSEYSYLIPMFELDLPHQKFALKNDRTAYDILHTNSIQHISKELAQTNDLFKEDDILISMRGISAIAIYRPQENKIVWATRGAWNHQHYVHLKEDGKIYIYDNDGGAKITDDGVEKVSRLIAYEPQKNKAEIIYYNPEHYNSHSFWRGYYKKLDNGHYIMNSSDKGRIMQINEKQEVVWEMRTVKNRKVSNIPYRYKITSTKFYSKDYLQPLLQSTGNNE